MGRTKGPYNLEFPTGTFVRIASADILKQFKESWRFHDPLVPEQLAYGGTVAKVRWTGIYFGGDELYALEGIPGIWHEQCLERTGSVR